MANKIREDKDNSLKIVFTNGCFDLIHVGHIRYLKEAKSLGDRLIVAINSDNSVKRLKPNRPIITETHRIEVLEAISFIDYVTVFEEDTPYELIKEIRPHVLVKGGDWRIEDIVGSDLVEETYSIKYHKGISTSAIIDKIVSLYC
ncbi:MAG: D-glycero-beta-D-manno-heptose 1-phosphate adenylyltransferase [Thermodesulfovibrionales bacterium]|nr:D-glycero-beta-D-manno-heptose 1-phosphate adenylyltransferase [Thermodesulfovibrionales bacterium]